MSPDDPDVHDTLDIPETELPEHDDIHADIGLSDSSDEDTFGAGAGGTASPYVVGDPDGAVSPWHVQEQQNSCAVAAQEFILDDFTGVDHTEAELREVAEQNGWFSPDEGTPVQDTGKLLAYYGIPTTQWEGASFDHLQTALADGDGVIVGVDSGEIWNPGFDDDDVLTDYMGIPGQGADHAVQVIGVDHSDPMNPQVILNDSGSPDGQGSRVPLGDFLDAWEDSGNFMVTAQRP